MKREKGFTLAELLIVVLILAILSTIAAVFFTGQTTKAENATADANLRSALLSARVGYLEAGGSYTSDPETEGETPEERANNFVRSAIESSTGLPTVLSSTPPKETIGVQMSPDGKEGTLYALRSDGWTSLLLPK